MSMVEWEVSGKSGKEWRAEIRMWGRGQKRWVQERSVSRASHRKFGSRHHRVSRNWKETSWKRGRETAGSSCKVGLQKRVESRGACVTNPIETLRM